MPYKFEDPNKLTFRALKFNGMLFAVGRGLFIHFMKYHPSIIDEQNRTSKSKTPFTLENFAAATRAQKEYFKGLHLEYEAVEKIYRDEIKALSSIGEGWWPERKNLPKPGIDYDLTYANFLMNYEGDHYYRRLGKGNNIPNERRIEYQSGVEFTRGGYVKAIRAYRELVGQSVLFDLPLPLDRNGWFYLGPLSALNPIPEIKPVNWLVWKIKNRKDREEWLKQCN